MGIRFEPRIEAAIENIQKKSSLPRWKIILALEGDKRLKNRVPKKIWQEAILEVEKDHKEPIELTMLKARFGQAGAIANRVQKVHHRHPTLLEKLGDATVKPFIGLPIAAIILIGVFKFFITTAGFITDGIMVPFFEGPYDVFIRSLIEGVFPRGFIHDMLLGTPGAGYLESFGILTTGIFVPIGIVLPAVLIFYIILTLLEDVGYLPRLAILVDTIFHRIGLHGYSIVPVILSFGCNVPGVMAARVLTSDKQRFMMLTLLGISIPCMAQTAVILRVIGPFGLHWVILIYLILMAIFVSMGSILNRVLKGEAPEIAIEIPPYRLPRISNLVMKTGLRIQQFLLEAIPWVFVGIILVNILHTLRITDYLSQILSPLLGRWLGLPKEAIYPLIIGFLRKDVATGLLIPLLNENIMNFYQAVIAVAILVIYFPCAATFVVFLKELGIRGTIKSTLIMLVVAFGVGGLLHSILFSLFTL
ncbi:MAG: nucleoside recognition domain-containing protein [Candidatus Aerophobetes bacterium]|nr:nucleoside recognition domain-containing protein [Candidatus Aerophobetes bacterium]